MRCILCGAQCNCKNSRNEVCCPCHRHKARQDYQAGELFNRDEHWEVEHTDMAVLTLDFEDEELPF
jgi:hypothetical protein